MEVVMLKRKISWLALICATQFVARGYAGDAGMLPAPTVKDHGELPERLFTVKPNDVHKSADKSVFVPPGVDFFHHGITEPTALIEPEAPQNEPGGALSASKNPADRERLEQALYWETRGRSDLAAKARAHIKQAESRLSVVRETGKTGDQNRPVGQAAVSLRPAPDNAPALLTSVGSATLPVTPQKPKDAVTESPMPKASSDEKAKYWQAHGRSDLAPGSHNVLSGADTPAAPIPIQADSPLVYSASAPAMRTIGPDGDENIPEVPVSRQELDERVRYWESRGRSDLANRLRQKLQTEESGYAANRLAANGGGHAESSQRIDPQKNIERFSSEDELLKHPDSLKARLDLASIYQSTGEMSKARVLIADVLASHPDLPGALLASAELYAAQRLWPETLHELEKISPVARTAEMARLQKRAWAHVQIDRADAMVKQGNNAEAELLLRRVAAELAVNANQMIPPEPPPLWKRAIPRRKP